MIADFMTWWGRTLLGLLPARLSRQDRPGQDALILAPVDGRPDRIALSLRRAGQDRPLGAFTLGEPLPDAARRRPRVLRLPGAAMLQRDIALPLAAEPRLDQVVRYEIDRVTPFAADELHWTCFIRTRDRAHARLQVGLAFVPRAAIRPLLDALAAAGLSPTTLEAGAPGTSPATHIDLRPDRPARSALARITDQALAALCAALILAVAATPFLIQARDRARIEATIAALRPDVDAAEAARRRIAAAAAGIDVIAADRARLGDTLAVLAAITTLLPDGTVLTDLTLRDGKLTLAGESDAAARLIGALSTDPAIRNPDFAAPVTRANTGKADLFAIRAEIGH